MKKVFTTGQIATICKVAPRTVGKWCDAEKGGLKCTRLPGNRKDRRVERSDLIDFLKRKGMKIPPELEEIQYNVLLVGTGGDLKNYLVKVAPEVLGSFEIQDVESSHQATYILGRMVESSPITCLVVDLKIGKEMAVSMAKAIRDNPELNSIVLIGLGSMEAVGEDQKGYFTQIMPKKGNDGMDLAKQIRSLVDVRKLPKIPTKCG